MTLHRTRLRVFLGLGVLFGVGSTLANWWLACRDPMSEACVWGRAFLPVSLVLGALAGLVLAAVAYGITRIVRQT